jgi:cytoskeletal protein CcmA (bactofilin family)
MFGKKQRGKGVVNTLIGEGTRVKGDVRFEGGCHIDGVVHGNVIAENGSDSFLTISENGLVEGSVRVPRVSLDGKVQGDLYASDAVTLGPTAKVVGNVHYEMLEMMPGAEINGKLIHESSQSKPAPKPAQPEVSPQAEQRRPMASAPEPVKQT